MKFPGICIVDYGSQTTTLIAKISRRMGIFSEIIKPEDLENKLKDDNNRDQNIYGVILSGGPRSVNDSNELYSLENEPFKILLKLKIPVLGICYGAQLISKLFGAQILPQQNREYGSSQMKLTTNINLLQDEIMRSIIFGTMQVWMSHSDLIQIPKDSDQFQVFGTTDQSPSMIKITDRNWYGFQFHPEVTHSSMGKELLENFMVGICQIPRKWNSKNFIETQIPLLKNKIGSKNVLMACSGGVDSTVTALMLNKAIGTQFVGIFINNGLLRKNEYQEVMQLYKDMNLNVVGLDSSNKFYQALKGVTEPEQKRKVIGNLFIQIFHEIVKKCDCKIEFLGQGTIYPDVIESMGGIKSHHNVGGLPKKLGFKLVEPLRDLFKDEVRQVGLELGLRSEILNRHPFPGPGLAIRIIGEVTPERVKILQEADYIFINALKTINLNKQSFYEKVWQAGAILLNDKSVGVMGDNRTFESVLALRAVTSVDGMTANVALLPMDFLVSVGNLIVNNVKGINRVVYDVTTKPPGTIEWQ